MKIFKVTVVTSLISLGLFISSCQKEQNEIDSPSIDQISIDQNKSIMDALCNDGETDCDQISISDTDIMIHNCSSFEKHEFLNFLNTRERGYETDHPIVVVPDPNHPGQTIELSMDNVQYYDENNQPKVESRHRLYSPMQFVKASKASNIKYYIRSSIHDDCDSGLAGAISTAISNWNNVEGCRVKFSLASSQGDADIVIGCDTDAIFTGDFKNITPPSVAIARSPSPLTRAPGTQISVSDNFSGTFQKGIMIHEIGHTLGFRHTDGNKGWHMYDTPKSEANSIMNATIPQTNEMSNEDKIAIRRLWPDKLKNPTGVSFKKVGNMVKIKLKNPDSTIRPYNHINVGHLYNGTFRWGNWAHQPDDNGDYSIYWIKYFGPGTHKFYVQGASHANEVLSGAIGWFEVEM